MSHVRQSADAAVSLGLANPAPNLNRLDGARKCGRRMVVQVTPTGWSARCVEHGTINSEDDGR